MTVHELITLLQQEDPRALVVYDYDTYEQDGPALVESVERILVLPNDTNRDLQVGAGPMPNFVAAVRLV